VNSFADDTSTVNGEREGATETGGDFVSYLGDFGLDVHVGCEEDPTVPPNLFVFSFPIAKRRG
jgi:hypothetical protein